MLLSVDKKLKNQK